ncbi:zinc finger BED domain-containing protein RICESLEEPER 4-like [Camellia sinensis]|uniref:zinc finger BED domain-containing protein RICESLEEPER 4-like n=1 Tax=Camellia sinensis TaxID=4442 RepID=UPI001036F059|nr:zinc finger BED domain-containing protein RICESLEEPER 4-like [Camellia sinensis]
MDKDNNASFESTGSPIVPPESSNSQTNVSPSESKPPKPPNKRKNESSGGRAPSSVWDHFDKVIREDGKRRAVCKYCFKEYMADSRTHGTSNLRSHTPNCKQFPNNDKDGQQTLSFKSKQNVEEGVEVVATSFSFEACKRALAEMVIIDELPFRFVEGVGFKRFCNVAVPKFTPIPSRHTIAREVTNIFYSDPDQRPNCSSSSSLLFISSLMLIWMLIFRSKTKLFIFFFSFIYFFIDVDLDVHLLL